MIGIIERFSTAIIDATSTGNTIIKGHKNTNEVFYPLFAIVAVVGLNSFTSAPTVSIGKTASNYDDYVTATALTGMNLINEYLKLDITGIREGISSSEDARINITVAASAVIYLIDVHLFGFYNSYFAP